MDKVDYIAAYKKHGSHRKAAKSLNLPKTTFQKKLKEQEQVEAFNKLGLRIIGSEEVIHKDLDLTGTSQMFKTDDGIIWVKTKKGQKAQHNHLRDVAESLIKEIKPRKAITLSSKVDRSEELCTQYTIADFHMGMYANILETGDTWNIKKAINVFKNFIHHASNRAMDSKQAVLVNLGDMSHTDGNTPHTTSRKHAIDVSGRFNEIRDSLIECFDYALAELLQKHEHVHVVYCRGNHDSYTAPLIRDMIARAYMKEPRVTFDRTDGYYHKYVWGRNGFFYHHGHKLTMQKLAQSFVAQFPKEYGSTDFRYGHCGHRHHEKLSGDEFFGIKMKQHDTLAPLDAHGAELGFTANCRASFATYHKEFGIRREDYISVFELLS